MKIHALSASRTCRFLGWTCLFLYSLATSFAATAKIYWTETRLDGSGYVMQADADGSNVSELVSGASNIKGPNGLEYGDGRLFWPDQQMSAVKCVAPDGSGLMTFATASNPYDVFIGDRVYWTSQTGNYVDSATLAGGDYQRVMASDTVTSPFPVEVAGGFIYWGEVSGNGRIRRSDLNGANATTLVNGVFSYDIQIAGSTLYFGDNNFPAALKKSNLDGSGVTTVTSVGFINGIWVSKDSIYWSGKSDDGTDSINKVGLAGGASAKVISRPAGTTVRGVVVLEEMPQCGVISASVLKGKTVTYSIDGGAAPYATSGSYRIQFAATGNTFTVLDSTGAAVGSGDSAGSWSFGSDLGFSTVVFLNFSPSGNVEKILMAGDCFFERYKDGQVADQTGHYTGAIGALPPRITLQPVHKTVPFGAPVTFTVATDAAAPTYQWRKDGVAIAGANAATLTVPAANFDTFGRYSAVITSASGSVTSSPANLSYVQLSPAAAVLPIGGRLTLSAQVIGPEAISTYDWQKDGASLSSFSVSYGVSNIQLTGAGDYTVTITTGGATGTSAPAHVSVITPVAASYKGKSFAKLVDRVDAQTFYTGKSFTDYRQVTLKNGAVTFLGVVTSESNARGVYTVTVADGLKKQVDLTTAIPGGTGNFTFFGGATPFANNRFYFTGIGAGTPAQYGIYLFDNGVVTKIFDTTTTIPGKSSTFADFGPVQQGSTDIAFGGGRSGTGAFRGVYRSNGSTLATVADFDSVAPPGPNKYVTMPSLVAFEGTSLAFAASEGGTFKVGLYGAFNGGAVQRIANVDTVIPGTATAIGGFGTIVLNNNKISFVAGTGASASILRGDASGLQVIAKVGDTVPNRSLLVTDFNAAGLTGESDGLYFGVNSGTLYSGIYRWKNGTVEKVIDTLDTVDGLPIRVVKMAASQGDDVVANIQFYNGQFGLWGTIGGTAAAIAPSITQQPVAQTVNVGNSATFTVTATGTAPLAYLWTKVGGAVVGENSATLTLNNVQLAAAGDYRVVVSNSAGSATSVVARLTVNAPELVPPTIAIKTPASNARVTAANLTVTGAASDNVGVATVKVRVINSSGTTETPATGTANWSANIVLAPGTNNVTAIATDASGNTKEAKITVFFDKSAALNLQIVGGGKVAPTATSLIVGKSYTINATPNPGFAFAGWTVNGAGKSGSSLTFTMLEGMTIVATFNDAKAPEVSITTPKANLRLNANGITIAGKASDNTQVDKVFVKLNDGAFEEASGKTNWTKSVILKAGSNTIQVFAKDSAGLVSKTNTITVTYVVSADLHVQVVPAKGGKVVPVTDGQRLEVGKSFTANATPNPGFKFLRWSGDVPAASANKSPLQIAMKEGGLTIVAEFADNKAPDLAVASPKTAARVTDAAVQVKGTAADNLEVKVVKVQLNNGEWTDAVGTTSWQKDLTLVAGPNTIRAYAQDTEGNRSKTNSITITYVKMAKLIVAPFPTNAGSIAPSLNGQMLEVGKSVALTATAKPGFAFLHWEGDFETNKPALRFTMPDREVHLQAEFKDTANPSVTVTAPKPAQKIIATDFVASGAASDNGRVAFVFYRVDATAFTTATGTTNWTAALSRLTPGNHTLQVYAVDEFGNYSKTNTVAFSVQGIGLLAPKEGTANAELELAWDLSDANLTITFATEPGKTYTVQSTEDLETWTDVRTITADSTQTEFSEPLATAQPSRFYRVIGN